MENQPSILRISYHPSSPYASCTLNQHNVSGNDDRTNQYGIYGATPRIIIQGEVQPAGGGNFSNPSLFDDYTGELSPLSIEITTDTTEADSISISLIITVEDDLDIIHQNPILYAGLAEDTIFFNAPNGESEHINVFRKELNGTTGAGLNIPDVPGFQITYNFTVKRSLDWDMSRIFAFATIQDASSNEVLQSGASNFTPDLSASVSEMMQSRYKYQFVDNLLKIQLEEIELFDQVLIFDLQGKINSSENISYSTIEIDLHNLNPSMYIVQLINTKVPASTSFKLIR